MLDVLGIASVAFVVVFYAVAIWVYWPIIRR
jgi:cbb3-type cytochrome oxidase subunit 3